MPPISQSWKYAPLPAERQWKPTLLEFATKALIRLVPKLIASRRQFAALITMLGHSLNESGQHEIYSFH